MPQAFDGYVEQPVRVSGTCLVYLQRNRYSVPAECVFHASRPLISPHGGPAVQ
jgi:hypothetical protein